MAGDNEEGKASIRFGGRLGVELNSATNVDLVTSPGFSPGPGPSPGLHAHTSLPDVRVGSRLASISSVQDVSTDLAYGSGVAQSGGSPSPGPPAVSGSATPSNQRHKQRRSESWGENRCDTHTHTHNQHPVNIHTLSTYIPCQHTYPANTPFVITPPSTPPGTPAATRQGLASTGLPLPLPRSSYPCPPPSWGCCLLYAPSPRRTTTPTATRDQG